MNNKKLERWAQLLLDTGKRNNMINFRTTKASTAEVVYPDGEAFFDKCLSTSSFDIYDPKISDDEDDQEAVSSANSSSDETQKTITADKMKKSDYAALYSSKIHKANQVFHFFGVFMIDKLSKDGVDCYYCSYKRVGTKIDLTTMKYS
jgi:hypothetical protein